MKRICIGVLVIVLWVTMGVGQEEDAQRKLIRVNVSGQSRETVLQFLNRQLDITSFDAKGKTVDVLLSKEGIDRMKGLGLPLEVLIDDIDAYEQNLRQQDYLDHFHTYAQMLDEMERVAADYPEIAKLVDIGDSWEKTQGIADRDIWAMKISDNVDLEETQEAEVLYMGCLHAREIITPEIVLYFMHYLVSNYRSDPEVTFLVDNRQLWLVPMVNPDGHEFVFDDDLWWRKNKSDNNNNGRFDKHYDGVDLNRNFGFQWGFDDTGSSPWPHSETYRGSAPFSEPETQAIRDLVETHTFILSLSYHSYGNLFLFPWGYISENTPDHETFLAIGDSATIFNGYVAGNSATGAIYITNGDSDDWLYGEQTTKNKVFGFTPEVGSGADNFHPDTSRIMPLIEENLWPNVYVARIAEGYAPRPVIHHTPVRDIEDTAGPYVLSAEIASAVFPLDTSSPKVYFNTTGFPPFDSTVMSSSGDSGIFIAQIPSQGENVSLYYYFSARDTVPRTGYAPPGAPDSLYSFHVGSDTVQPLINHTPHSYRSVYNTPIRIEAHVTDNLGISEVRLVYRINDGSLDSTRMSAYDSDVYVSQIGWDEPKVGEFVEYWIRAFDSSSRTNSSCSPESGSYYLLLIESVVFDFEADDAGFTTDSESDWQWGRPTSGPEMAASGTKVWATQLNGAYSDSSDSKLDTSPIDLRGYGAATMSFNHWYKTESRFGRVWDGGNLKISEDNGPFEVIFPTRGYDDILLPIEGNPLVGESLFGGPLGVGDFWHQETFDLSPFVDHTVILRFHFGSNETVTAPGWYIDDVEIRFASSTTPTFYITTQFSSTDDTTGPYRVWVSITDDMSITQAYLLYRREKTSPFHSVTMDEIIPFLYKGLIPGQAAGTTVQYYLKAEDDSGNVALDPPGAPDSTYSFIVGTETDVDLPEEPFHAMLEEYQLRYNYPNPFNPTTSIQYSVVSAQSPPHVTLKIYNLLGQELVTLVNERQESGYYTVTWDASDMSSGVYLYRLEAGRFRATKRMVLLK